MVTEGRDSRQPRQMERKMISHYSLGSEQIVNPADVDTEPYHKIILGI